jgi:hypothetical protein
MPVFAVSQPERLFVAMADQFGMNPAESTLGWSRACSSSCAATDAWDGLLGAPQPSAPGEGSDGAGDRAQWRTEDGL